MQISSSEPKAIISYLQSQTQVDIKNLTEMPFGDYAWLHGSDPEGLERKFITDFVSSMFSERLTVQLQGCFDEYKKVYLLIEGVWDCDENRVVVYKKNRNGLYVPAFYSPGLKYCDIWEAIKTVLVYAEVVFSPSPDASAEIILSLSKGAKESNNFLTRMPKQKRIPTWTRDKRVRKLLNLVDRLPENVAVELIKQFSNIGNIISASEDELVTVKGMGKGLVRNLRDAIG